MYALGAGLTLVALVLVAALGNRTRLRDAAALGGVAVLWLLVNNTMEGGVLLRVTTSHGLTTGDLAGLAAIVVAGWRVWTIGRRGRTPRGRVR